MPEYMQPLHLTTRVERRLPPDAVAEVERIEREWPHKEQCEKNPFVSGQTCIQLMLELRTVLDKCTTWPPSLHVPCVMHGCPGVCNIRALAVERQQLEERIQSGLNHVGSFSSSSKTDTGGSSTVPLFRSVFAGVSCIDFCQSGDQLMWQGPSTVHHMTYAYERKYLNEDFGVTECSRKWDPTILQDAVEDTHDLDSGIICPTDLGDPVRRERRYTRHWKRSRIVPIMDFETFFNTFKRTIAMPGTYFLAADDLMVDAALKKKFNDIGIVQLAGQRELTWRDTLTYAQNDRLSCALELQAQRGDENLAPSFIVDLNHNPEVYARYTRTPQVIVPSLLRHNVLWCHGRNQDNKLVDRPLLAQEIISIQGLATLPEHGDVFQCEWLDCMASLEEHQIQSLAGNSMHFHIAVVNLLWFLSCCQFVEPLPQRMGSGDDVDDDVLDTLSEPSSKRFRASED